MYVYIALRLAVCYVGLRLTTIGDRSSCSFSYSPSGLEVSSGECLVSELESWVTRLTTWLRSGIGITEPKENSLLVYALIFFVSSNDSSLTRFYLLKRTL